VIARDTVGIPRLQELASSLRQAYSVGPIAPIRDEIGRDNQIDAYLIQQFNTDHWIDNGRRLTGRKIGLTAKSVQAQLGVEQPDYGALFADMEIDEDDGIALSRVQQPRIEAEVAFVLERDLLMTAPSLADVIRAIAFALPALEIVSSRIAGWNIGIVDTIADNASSGLFVLGGVPRRIETLDLHNCAMVMRRGNDESVSRGVGANCLGNPLIALRWLARKLVEMETPLKTGDVVLSGALGPMIDVAPCDRFEAEIEGLGRVRASFADQ
jgi:2-keto-4-pentenoate hydratase